MERTRHWPFLDLWARTSCAGRLREGKAVARPVTAGTVRTILNTPIREYPMPSTTAVPSPINQSGWAPLELLNEGLDPGARVFIDDDPQRAATVCSVDPDAPVTVVVVDGVYGHRRVATWRLARFLPAA